MLSKKGFDLIIITVALVHPVAGLFRMASRRWVAETAGPLNTVGRAVQVAL